ncbi:hypothetical protein T03_4033 [Trichinella britovi]|uniref:Uncharacterized protein n=1 Tax=Trichinella britovi TaxID=45882 RepID=A0A0V1AIZ7_TRIBR|nr:hypothetical protein T03_4033 [Trichinella britovi]
MVDLRHDRVIVVVVKFKCIPKSNAKSATFAKNHVY